MSFDKIFLWRDIKKNEKLFLGLTILQNILNFSLATLTICEAFFMNCDGYYPKLYVCHGKKLDIFAWGIFIAAIFLTTLISTVSMINGVKNNDRQKMTVYAISTLYSSILSITVCFFLKTVWKIVISAFFEIFFIYTIVIIFNLLFVSQSETVAPNEQNEASSSNFESMKTKSEINDNLISTLNQNQY